MNKLKSSILSHLLEEELAGGNTIDKIESGWSKMDTVIRLKKPLNQEAIKKLLDENPLTLRSFTSNDPHYPKESGLIHKRESIVGPS
ncbi:MAG: hypothetical protein PWP62_862 [Eubacteriaceae bacterium]|jgi:hypothetical protein|nr:hypothetical protein [Eubacteriaceae bacterium]